MNIFLLGTFLIGASIWPAVAVAADLCGNSIPMPTFPQLHALEGVYSNKKEFSALVSRAYVVKTCAGIIIERIEGNEARLIYFWGPGTSGSALVPGYGRYIGRMRDATTMDFVLNNGIRNLLVFSGRCVEIIRDPRGYAVTATACKS